MTGTVKSGKRDQSGLGRMGFAHYSRVSLSQSSGLVLVRPPLPDVPGQENCGGGAGQASESAAAEAHNPRGKLRCPPPNRTSVTPNRSVPRNPAAKPMQE